MKTYVYRYQEALVNAHLKKKIYIDQPQGFTVKGKEIWAYRLHKALYNLCQSFREFHQHLKQILKEMGCVISEADSTLYLLKTDSCLVFMLVYVDRILMFSGEEQGLISLVISSRRNFRFA